MAAPVSSTVEQRPAPDRGGRRAAIAIAGAGAVVAVTITIIVVVGLVPLPAMPSLAQAPDPAVPGTVAFVQGDWEEACLATVPASGGRATTVRCSVEVPEALAWTTEGDLAMTVWGEPFGVGDGPTVVVVDPVTGDEVDRLTPAASTRWAEDRLVRDDGARLLVAPSRGGEVTLRVRAADGAITDLVHLTGPRDYGVVSAQWSPDGRWVLAADTRGRLFLLGADGVPGPRLLVDAGGRDTPVVLPAWWIDDADAQRVDLATGAAGS